MPCGAKKVKNPLRGTFFVKRPCGGFFSKILPCGALYRAENVASANEFLLGLIIIWAKHSSPETCLALNLFLGLGISKPYEFSSPKTFYSVLTFLCPELPEIGQPSGIPPFFVFLLDSVLASYKIHNV